MKRLASALLIVLLAGLVTWGITELTTRLAWAQTANPVRFQSSPALEASHVFTGTRVVRIQVTWHIATAAARWFMLFDASALPANGAVTPAFCSYITASASATDGSQMFDFENHPMWMNTGVVAAVSSTSCFTLTKDAANERFDAQVVN
jgi:hypothetical protein